MLLGTKLIDLLEDPSLRNLVGGTQAVTLGDDLAFRRNAKPNQRNGKRQRKTVLERKGLPCFDVIVEMREPARWIVILNVAEAVDALLEGEYTDSMCHHIVI